MYSEFFMSPKNSLPAPERAEPKVSFDVGANDVAMTRRVFMMVCCGCGDAVHHIADSPLLRQTPQHPVPE
jgi:hypothetical protein